MEIADMTKAIADRLAVDRNITGELAIRFLYATLKARDVEGLSFSPALLEALTNDEMGPAAMLLADELAHVKTRVLERAVARGIAPAEIPTAARKAIAVIASSWYAGVLTDAEAKREVADILDADEGWS